jgi:hydroxyacyl-ACP dehydratase HTD2-like protein with hotdog domain
MPRLDRLTVGDALPERRHTATNVSLFLYNAAVWNAHRIHYDEPYTTGVEHHPGIVIDGPLQGDWLTQVVVNWLGDDGRLLEFEYSNRRASMLGETLTAGGSISAIDGASVTLDLWIRNERGEVTTPGRAMVSFAT